MFPIQSVKIICFNLPRALFLLTPMTEQIETIHLLYILPCSELIIWCMYCFYSMVYRVRILLRQIDNGNMHKIAKSVSTCPDLPYLSWFEVRIEISVTRDNCVWRVTRLRRVPAKTVILRGGHSHAHRKKHERYFFLHKTLFSLFSLIFYQIISSKTAPFVQNNKLFTS